MLCGGDKWDCSLYSEKKKHQIHDSFLSFRGFQLSRVKLVIKWPGEESKKLRVIDGKIRVRK